MNEEHRNRLLDIEAHLVTFLGTEPASGLQAGQREDVAEAAGILQQLLKDTEEQAHG